MKTIKKQLVLATLFGIAISLAPAAIGQSVTTPYLQDFNPPFPTYVSPDYLGWEGPLNNAIWLQNCVGTSWVNFDGSPVMNMRNRETVTGTPMVGERLPNWLISPDVLITDPDAIISWVEAASTNIWAGPRNSPRNLWISVGFGPWTFVDSYSSGSLPDAYKGEGWRRKTYPLGAYTGQYIRWKWEMISEEQASAPDDNKWEYSYWCIDNVYIGSSAGTVPIYTLPAGYVWFVIDENPREGTITVSNGGPHLMNLQSVAVEGSSAFSITDQPSVYPVNISGFLDASGVPNVAIKVKFQPTTSGLIDGKLVVNYNGTASSFDFSGHSAVADFNCADAIPLTDLFCSEGPPAECKKSIVGPQGLAYVYTALYDQDVTISSCDPHNTTVPFSYCYETWLKVFSGCPTDPNTILLVNNDDQETNCGYNRASSAGTFHMARNETAYIYWPLVFPYAAHAYDDFVFTITVTPTPPWPDAEFTADKTVISTGESVNFLCNSTGSPTIWAWEFPGSTQESSTLENPMGITYPLAGNYQVKLTASNAHFSGNMTKIAYIIVAEAGSEPETEQIPGGSEGFTVGGLKIGSAITSTEWTFGDNNGLGMNWQIRNTGINACSVNEPVMPSTTGYSGYLVLPAVEYNCAGGIPTNVEVDAFAQSPAFDCSGYDVIIYQFQQRFYANGQQPRMELQVSKDGGYNWKSFDLLQGRGLNTLWGNPVETAQINITEVAGRQSDVRVRFYWKGSTNYFWMIDDVEV
ncbi:MAG: PKD domain-containing protein, partial [Bacteroidia bacterium]|nr:PKD domain-containing protein [Bacteroidia bacterium]